MSERKPLTDEYLDSIWKEMLKSDAKKPPRLDRSAWEPCEHCGGKRYCDDCEYDSYGCSEAPCDTCFGGKNWKAKDENFCNHCGHPLTDDAWDMLEKRLEGRQ